MAGAAEVEGPGVTGAAEVEGPGVAGAASTLRHTMGVSSNSWLHCKKKKKINKITRTSSHQGQELSPKTVAHLGSLNKKKWHSLAIHKLT